MGGAHSNVGGVNLGQLVGFIWPGALYIETVYIIWPGALYIIWS